MKTEVIDVVFDGPPGPESGRFVEVEDKDGKSIRRGEWLQRDDGYWVLRFRVFVPVCESCNDTHHLTRTKPNGDEVTVMCQRCPVPCDACRMRIPGGGLGPFCETTPCECGCHARKVSEIERLMTGGDAPPGR